MNHILIQWLGFCRKPILKQKPYLDLVDRRINIAAEKDLPGFWTPTLYNIRFPDAIVYIRNSSNSPSDQLTLLLLIF